jgi:tetratricopeptide (TPR) repeat protein
VVSWGKAPAVAGSREQLLEFWRLQRAGMDAIKIEGDPERAIGLFERALALDPAHEDSLYYLANCLATTGRVEQALDRLAELNRVNSLSHRGQKRWGTLRAVTARDERDLGTAVQALERAAEINPEETGVGLVLGEVHLMRGDTVQARQRLEWVVRSNPQSGEAFFVLAYLEWVDGNEQGAARRLEQAAGTRAEDWKPTGAAAEGDVKQKMHVESSPFEDLFEAWDGSQGAGEAFDDLDRRLREIRSAIGVPSR